MATQPTSDQLQNQKTTHSDWDLDAYKITNVNNLVNFKWDYVAATYPDSTTEVFTFKEGGVSGTISGTITLTYTDSGKENLSSAARS